MSDIMILEIMPRLKECLDFILVGKVGKTSLALLFGNDYSFEIIFIVTLLFL